MSPEIGARHMGSDEFTAFVLDDADPREMLARPRENLHAFNLMQERTCYLAVRAGAVECNPAGGKALADREMYLQKRSCLR